MTAKDTKALLTEIRDQLKAQQATLEELKTARPQVHRSHWRMLLLLAIATLGVGSIAAYQYYLTLQSIIGQFPGR